MNTPTMLILIKCFFTPVYRAWKCDFVSGICAYLCPNSSVDLVSASLKEEGEQQMTMVVRQFPPRESCKILVILLSLYGT